MSVTREKLEKNAYAKQAENLPGVTILSDEAREASRLSLLRRAKPGQDIWIFAYGSLIWNPAFHFTEQCPGQLFGFHRSFCLWTFFSRGTRQQPGLALALDRGGSCHGLLFRIAPDKVDSETSVIWAREMFSGIYCPRWVTAHTEIGPLQAITFVADREKENYTGRLPLEDQAQIIARAEGQLGSCSDYLTATVSSLKELNIVDQGLYKLNSMVQEKTDP